MKMEKKREIQISNKIDLNRELEKKKKKETYIDSNRNVRCNLKNNNNKKKNVGQWAYRIFIFNI
jgi:hypothetical protein